jgi:hypothetical protein
MAEVVVRFTACDQNSQEAGTDDEHMVSRLFFSVEVDGKHLGDYHVDLKQTVRSDMVEGLIEVPRPDRIPEPWNQNAFANEARAYFRQRVRRGAKVMTMIENRFEIPKTVRFTATDVATGSW